MVTRYLRIYFSMRIVACTCTIKPESGMSHGLCCMREMMDKVIYFEKFSSKSKHIRRPIVCTQVHESWNPKKMTPLGHFSTPPPQNRREGYWYSRVYSGVALLRDNSTLHLCPFGLYEWEKQTNASQAHELTRHLRAEFETNWQSRQGGVKKKCVWYEKRGCLFICIGSWQVQQVLFSSETLF